MPGTGYKTADATVSAYRAVAVTLNDSTVIPNTRGLYIGSGGDLKVTMYDGTIVTFSNTVGGTILPIQVVTLWSSVTTASNILALY